MQSIDTITGHIGWQVGCEKVRWDMAKGVSATSNGVYPIIRPPGSFIALLVARAHHPPERLTQVNSSTS